MHKRHNSLQSKLSARIISAYKFDGKCLKSSQLQYQQKFTY